MQISKTKAKKVVGLIALGVALTCVSALRKSEFESPPRVEPCVMQIFRVPLRQVSYGLPMFWLVSVEGVYKYGCGPIVGHFLTYSLLWQGFLVDVLFYTLQLFIISLWA